LLFRDGFEEGGCGSGPFDKARKKRSMSRLFLRKNFLRVPVLLSDRSGSLCSSFCGFKDDDESKSVDDGSTNSSSLIH
jgi:hypothetical protein